MPSNPVACNCGSNLTRYPLYDGRGIFLTYVCEECEEKKKSRYNPVILDYYTQADVDEPIEEQD